MFRRVCESVYQVGGAELSDSMDCLVYLVDMGDLVLVDCGAGPSWPYISSNIEDAGFEPARIHTLILTHCHIDHIGAAEAVKSASGCRILAHELDAEAIESAGSAKTAADWYGLRFAGVEVDIKMRGRGEVLEFFAGTMNLIHTPGHTPGSIAAVMDAPDDNLVLFGQDVHGPFSPTFDSDLRAWRKSMRDLIALEADILCEGHFGVFRGAQKVREFIEDHLALHP